MTTDYRDLVTRMRLATHRFRPYMARFVYAMPMHPVLNHPELPTLGVDRHGRCYFNPEFLQQATPEQGAYLLLHECYHVVLRHCHVMQQLIGSAPSPERRIMANVAVDLVVEQMLRGDLATHLPDGGVTHEQFGFPPNLSAPEYFRLLDQAHQSQQEQSHGNHDSNSQSSQQESMVGGAATQSPGRSGGDDSSAMGGASKGDQNGSAGRADHPGDSGGDSANRRDTGSVGEDPSAQSPEASRSAEAGTCGGSCADGVARSYELPPDPSWESHREDQAFAAIQKAIERHEATHGAGSVPGQLKLAICGKLRPQPNPWDCLRSAISASVSASVGCPEPSYRRLSRRQQPDLPRLKGRLPTYPTAVVILDTSASMCSGEDQSRALAVIRQGLSKLPSFRVFAGDTRICSDKSVSNVSHVEWCGGGGTDMAALIQEVDRKYRPDSIVLVTDGETPWPRRKPRARVIAALTRPKQRDFPPWATGIFVGSTPSQ